MDLPNGKDKMRKWFYLDKHFSFLINGQLLNRDNWNNWYWLALTSNKRKTFTVLDILHNSLFTTWPVELWKKIEEKFHFEKKSNFPQNISA